MDDSVSDFQSGHIPASERRATPQDLFPVPSAFAIGVVVFVSAVLNELNTMQPGLYAWLYTISFAASSAAAVCFVYAFKHGGIAARILAMICLLPVLWNAFSLLWAIAAEFKPLRV